MGESESSYKDQEYFKKMTEKEVLLEILETLHKIDNKLEWIHGYTQTIAGKVHKSNL